MKNFDSQQNSEEVHLELNESNKPDITSETRRQIGRIASEVADPRPVRTAPLSPEQRQQVHEIAKKVVEERPFTDY